MIKGKILAEAARYRLDAARMRERAQNIASFRARRIICGMADQYDMIASVMEKEGAEIA